MADPQKKPKESGEYGRKISPEEMAAFIRASNRLNAAAIALNDGTGSEEDLASAREAFNAVSATLNALTAQPPGTEQPQPGLGHEAAGLPRMTLDEDYVETGEPGKLPDDYNPDWDLEVHRRGRRNYENLPRNQLRALAERAKAGDEEAMEDLLLGTNPDDMGRMNPEEWAEHLTQPREGQSTEDKALTPKDFMARSKWVQEYEAAEKQSQNSGSKP